MAVNAEVPRIEGAQLTDAASKEAAHAECLAAKVGACSMLHIAFNFTVCF